MDSRSPPPDNNIEPEHCPEAVREWYRLTGLQDRKESAGRKDLALKAKQHLLSLGWKFWYIDKNSRWELRYTSPNNGKNHITLRKACESCIEEGGCSPERPSTAAPVAATSICSSPLQLKKRSRESEETEGTAISLSPLQSKKRPRESEETAAISIYSSPLQSKELPRESQQAAATSIYRSPLPSKEKPRESEEEATATTISLSPLKRPIESEEVAAISVSSESDESTSDDDSEASSASSGSPSDEDSETSSPGAVNKAIVGTVSTSIENEKHVSKSESEVTDLVGSDKRGKVLKTSLMEKNSEDCGRRGKVLKTSIMEKNSQASGKRGKVSKGEGKRERYSLVSWLIKNRVLVSGTNVFCRGSNNVVKRGGLFSDGIVCDCCRVNFTITGFEAHAGCTRHRPSTSILLGDGRSLLNCHREAVSSRDEKRNHCIAEANSEAGSHWVAQVNTEAGNHCVAEGNSEVQVNSEAGNHSVVGGNSEVGNHCVAKANYEANNDTFCSICDLGGDIVLCDQCPSAFHLSCLGLDRVPDGDWFCPTCCCKICYRPKCKQECVDGNDSNILVCVQCAQKFHFGCVKAIGIGSSHIERNGEKKNWFCSVVCGNMFLCLKKLLGKPITVAANLTWTLLKNVSNDDQKKRKLNVALDVLYESFNPTIDALSGRELIKDVVFSRGSEHKRLNFHGFYNVILEKMGKVVSVATIRIYGQKVAEIVFVATKEQYRRQGMCRLLMHELEKQLTRLGVGSLVLHSSEDAIDTWTKAFGFARITGEDKCQFVDKTFLEFQNTIMCLKSLNRPIWPCIA